MTFRSRTAVFFIAVFAAPAAALAQEAASDATLRSKVEAQLAGEDLGAIHVSVKDRAVTLRGTVPSAWAAKRAAAVAEDVAEKEDGKVVSRLTVADSRGGDGALAQAVAEELAGEARYGVFDSVSVHAQGGVVTLTGYVTQSSKARELGERAARVPGVQEVVDKTRLISASPMDDELRIAIARGIYDDPVFFRYAMQPNPPIHVVVDRGRVTLTGVVSSELERTKAEVIARGVPGSFAVESQLRIEK